jgi:hypothetical protein
MHCLIAALLILAVSAAGEPLPLVASLIPAPGFILPAQNWAARLAGGTWTAPRHRALHWCS